MKYLSIIKHCFISLHCNISYALNLNTRKDTIDKKALVLILGLILLFAGCDAKKNKNSNKSNVKVSDAADYATGVTQISIMKKSEKKLQNIYNQNKKQKEDALK